MKFWPIDTLLIETSSVCFLSRQPNVINTVQVNKKISSLTFAKCVVVNTLILCATKQTFVKLSTFKNVIFFVCETFQM
eukprot:TRINITY_DN12651_c0_g1_i1.p2 TRINITY_DN12651_c0_g1~~TRINITY_DN12651_c0_g1_i1.p2  ORF type:complete len:78 (+),score=1.85 TRINITY_DN12651_c0_g1_i1:626-859(+)